MPDLTPLIRQIAEATTPESARAIGKSAWKASDRSDEAKATIQWAVQVRTEEESWRVPPPEQPQIPAEDAARGLRWLAYGRGMMNRKRRQV